MATQHTPTPWFYTAVGDITDAQGRVIVNESGIHAYDVASNAFSLPNKLAAQDDGGDANAAFIVKAVNHHYALIVALTGLLDAFGGYCIPAVDAAIDVMQKLGFDRWSMQSQIDAEQQKKAIALIDKFTNHAISLTEDDFFAAREWLRREKP